MCSSRSKNALSGNHYGQDLVHGSEELLQLVVYYLYTFCSDSATVGHGVGNFMWVFGSIALAPRSHCCPLFAATAQPEAECKNYCYTFFGTLHYAPPGAICRAPADTRYLGIA